MYRRALEFAEDKGLLKFLSAMSGPGGQADLRQLLEDGVQLGLQADAAAAPGRS